MTAKTKRIISTIIMVIPAFILIMGGVMKIIDAEPQTVMDFLNKAGFGNYITLLGLTELIIAALFIYPKTNRVGFFLAISYFSGALSLELSAAAPPASAIFLVLLWVAMFLKNKQLFFPVVGTQNK